MKFLVDVCASSRALQSALTDWGHDVNSMVEVDPCASDDDVLSLANDESRVLITEDTDFGELVFVQRQDHPTIVRFVQMRIGDRVAAIEHHADDLQGRSIIVVTRDRIRIRKVESE